MTCTSPTVLQVEGSLYWYHLNHCTRAIDRETEVAEDVPREDDDDPGEGPSGVVLFDISPPGQPGDLNLDGLKEALMALLLEIRVDNSTLDEYDTPGPSHEPHLFGDRAGVSTIDFSHLSAD